MTFQGTIQTVAVACLAAGLASGAVHAGVEGANWKDLIPASQRATHFFVAPDGKAGNKGTKDSPWDLKSALEGQQSIPPGSVVWLRGGMYGKGGKNQWTLRKGFGGKPGKPIIYRQYPGERATLNGGIRAYFSPWTYFWGFEITNTSTKRVTMQGGRPGGINTKASAQKMINLTIHDAGHPAIGFWKDVGDGGEVHNCLLWANGLYQPDTHWQGNPRGSGIYAQNKDGKRYITDTISFRNFTNAMKAYTQEGYAWGFNLIGNVCFDNHGWNIQASGNNNNLKGLVLRENMTYRKPSDTQGSVQFAYVGRVIDLDCRDNYMISGAPGSPVLDILNWDFVNIANNTLYGSTAGFAAADFPSNTILKTRPTKGTKIFVRPNKYEYGRGNVVIFNWEKKSSVAVDISRILPKGTPYEVRDAQNFFAKKPLLEGTYDGKPVSIPMNLTEVAQPVGKVPHIAHRFKHTAPEFGVFVVLAKGPCGPATQPVADKTAAPTLFPAGGVFQGKVDVKLSAATEGVAVHYTTDGTEPTAASPKYTAPIALKKQTRVKARAFNKDGTSTSVADAFFRVVPERKAAKLSGGAPAGKLERGTTQVTLKVTTNEKATCRFAVRSNVPYAEMKTTFEKTGGTAHSHTVTGLKENTSYVFYIKSMDAHGNVNLLDYAVTFFVAGEHVSVRKEVEAETGKLTAPMEIKEDKNVSGGKYITLSRGDIGAASASYTVDVPVAGDYVVWVRVYTPAANGDSFYFSMDGKDRDVFDMSEDKIHKRWKWKTVAGRGGKRKPAGVDPRVFTLSAGQHTLLFAAREPRVRMDKVLVTNDHNFKPGD